MPKTLVRLLEISINNIKNVKHGKIILNNSACANKDYCISKSDILGIYGQNGSGKTTLIEVMSIIKTLFSGEELSSKVASLLSVGEQEATLELSFFVDSSTDSCNIKHVVIYSVTLQKNQATSINELEAKLKEEKVCIIKESLKYYPLEANKQKRKTTLISYNSSDDFFIFPQYLLEGNNAKRQPKIIDFTVAKEIAQDKCTSYIFSNKITSLLNWVVENNPNSPEAEVHKFLKILSLYARFDLYVITNEQYGLINASPIMPFNIRLQNSNSLLVANVAVGLFDTFVLPEKIYQALLNTIEQLNIVLSKIIPDLSLKVIEHSRELISTEDGIGVKLEVTSIRGEQQIPLRNESEGIKRIISILSAIIGVYNHPEICLVIDELDSGIFEFLLGELLQILEANAKGQFIFTAHNLRPLEKLNKSSIVFSTTNPYNRYFRLANVKTNNNLRDFYLREIVLGGQTEEMYSDTNTYEIQYALRKAGKINNEC